MTVRSKCVCFTLVIFCTLNLFSQSENQYIILKNNDTLRNIQIVQNYKFTNASQLTFKKKDTKKNALKPDDVTKYFDGKNMYYSVFPANSENARFISFFADGIYKAGLSYDSGGNMLFYVFNSEDYFEIKKEQDLESFFNKNFDIFNEFKKTYLKSIEHSYKSLGNLISALNEFVNPDLYMKVEYKNNQSHKVGINLQPPNPVNLGLFNSDFSFTGTHKFRAGISIENSFSNKFNILYTAAFDWHKYSDETLNFDYFSYILEVHPEFYLTDSEKINFKISPGISAGLNYGAKTNTIYTDDVAGYFSLSSFATDYILDIKVEFNKRFNIYLGIHSLRFKIIETANIPDTKKLNSGINGLRFGFTYYFKFF